MSALAIIALVVVAFLVATVLALALCASASQADDKLAREGRLPWGS